MALTAEQSKDLTDLLSRVELGEGLGTKSRPCSIAAVNLALYGRLTDEVPDCMSLVIGNWIILVQDLMPHGTRNCREYKIDLLPLAAGTGRDWEKEEARFNLLADWMWERVLPRVSTDEWPATLRHRWENVLKERSAKSVDELTLCGVDINLKPVHEMACSIVVEIAHLLTKHPCYPRALSLCTTFCIDADWEEGVWEDSDGLDVIGTLKRLIEA